MRRTLLPVALAATLLAACGGASSSSGSTAQPAASATAAPAATPGPTDTPASADTSSATGAPGADTTAAPAVAAPEALQFTAPLVGGGTIDFTQFAGKTVALWFWAPT